MSRRISIKEIRRRSREAVKAQLEKQLAGILKREGQRIIEEAFESKETKNDTYNQKDAYAWGLYKNRRLVSYGFVGPQSASRPAKGSKQRGVIWGRTEAEEWLHSYTPETDGYVLAVVNAIYYSAIHEFRGMRIVSQILSELEELEDRYGGRMKIVSDTPNSIY